MQPRVADGFVPPVYLDLATIGGQPLFAAANWPSANRAIYAPIMFPYPCTITSIGFAAGNGTGNYDLGFYDGYTKSQFAHTGSTAMTAAGIKTLTFASPLRVDAGRIYYGALALSSATGSTTRSAAEVAACIGAGCAQEASALPLPATMTPATIAAAYVPLFVFGIR